jgi:hypothetical protein
MQTVIITDNILDAHTWQKHRVKDVRDFIMEQYPERLPDNTRIYKDQIAVENDITPQNEDDINNLTNHELVWVVIYPADPVTAVIAIVAIVAVAAAAFLLVPDVPSVVSNQRNTNDTSSNNELSDRSNKPRPNARIPDIYGQVTSTPDLLAVPYKIFEDNQELEVAYMCIGRGEYDISDVRDGDTLISEISGASVQFYGPNTSPNSGDAAQLTIGDAITDDVLSVTRVNEVNGQLLRPPNVKLVGDSNIKFVHPNIIEAESGSGIDFTEFFRAGESITIANSSSGIPGGDLDGDYTTTAVSSSQVSLYLPETINSFWNDLETDANFDPDNETAYVSPTLSNDEAKWEGPFTLDITTLDKVLCNFIALNGLYKDDGSRQQAENIDIEIELTPVDSNGDATGSAETVQGTLNGSSLNQQQRAVTIEFDPTFTGRMKIRVRRVTDTDFDYNGTVVDDIKWRDLYAVSPVSATHFGDITSVHSKTYATTGALSVKDRKLNCLVTRKIPQRISGSDFTTELYATKSADEILAAVCLDQQIGNRSSSEIDFDSIYDTIARVKSYFGNDEAAEFSYTFDKENLSFEETVSLISDAAFCNAYRQGNVIKLNFEEQASDSSLIYNHRNKFPGSETRTVRFGNQNNHDGLELEYQDETDDALVTYYIPADRTALNPKTVETVGVRSFKQAFWHAQRAWNKIQYQNIAVEFDATQEAAVSILKERVLIADNTRSETQDGQVESQNGLELTLSQNITLNEDKEYYIFLQHVDGTTESIAISAGTNANQVILNSAPRATLALDDDLYAKATYIIAEEDKTEDSAFLITEKDSKSNFEYTIRAANYSNLYYQADQLRFWQDFENSDIQDKSAYNETVTEQGDGSIVSDATRGNVYSSGTTGYFGLSDFTITNYCVMAWIKPTNGGEIFALPSIIAINGFNQEHRFYVDGDTLIFKAYDTIYLTTGIDSEQWQHVILNFDNTTKQCQLWLNGSKLDTTTISTDSADGYYSDVNNISVDILNYNTTNRYDGYIDDLRLYSSYLTDDMIKDIYKVIK